MKLVNTNNQREFQLINSKKPKMTIINGRSWTIWTSIYVDGKKIDMHCDTTWGEYGYLNINNKWYKIGVIDMELLKYEEQFIMQRGNILK